MRVLVLTLMMSFLSHSAFGADRHTLRQELQGIQNFPDDTQVLSASFMDDFTFGSFSNVSNGTSRLLKEEMLKRKEKFDERQLELRFVEENLQSLFPNPYTLQNNPEQVISVYDMTKSFQRPGVIKVVFIVSLAHVQTYIPNFELNFQLVIYQNKISDGTPQLNSNDVLIKLNMIEKMNEGGANAMNQDQEGRYLEFRGLSSEILSDHYNGQEFKDILFRKDSFAIRLIRDQATELIDQETNRHNRDEFLDKIKALSKTIKYYKPDQAFKWVCIQDD